MWFEFIAKMWQGMKSAGKQILVWGAVFVTVIALIWIVNRVVGLM